MQQAGITPVDVVATLGRNLRAKKVTFDSEGGSYEVDDGPTQIHAANILLKGMRILTGGDVNVFQGDGNGKAAIMFGMPDLNAPPEEDEDTVEGEYTVKDVN